MGSEPGAQSATSARSWTVAGTTSRCARAMLAAMAFRTPRRGSADRSPDAAAASTSAVVTTPPGPEPVNAAMSTPSRCARPRTAGVAATEGAGGMRPTTVAASVELSAPKVTSGVPTGTTSPGSPWRASIVPARGEGTSTTALSVSTVTRG